MTMTAKLPCSDLFREGTPAIFWPLCESTKAPMGLGYAVRWCVERCWGCCCARQTDLNAAHSQICADDADDVELPLTDRVDDLYTRLLPKTTEPLLDPKLVPIPLNSPPLPPPCLSFSNMLMHDSVIADRLELKKMDWTEDTPEQHG